jgi:hypothetical protein
MGMKLPVGGKTAAGITHKEMQKIWHLPGIFHRMKLSAKLMNINIVEGPMLPKGNDFFSIIK